MRALLGLATLVGALLALPATAPAACTTGRCTNPTAVDDVRALVASACDCAGETSHKKYLHCAKDVIRAAVKDGSLPKECRKGVWGCEVQSTCGTTGTAAVCCVQRRGKVKAKLMRKSGRCPGTSCAGALSVDEACAADASCRPATRGIRAFQSVQRVFQTSCALPTCHSTMTRQGDLVLDSEDVSYASLVNRPAALAEANGMPRVKPGDPAGSFLIRKLRGQGPGTSMPQNAPALPEAVIQMVESWIQRGAKTTKEECETDGRAAACEPADAPVGNFVWHAEAPLEPPAQGTGVQMVVPPRDVAPGTEWERCWAFRLKDLLAAAGMPPKPLPAIKQQIYRMNSGSHHLLLYGYIGDNPDGFKYGPDGFECFAANCLNDGECPDDNYRKLPMGGTQVAGTHYEVDYPAGVGIPTNLSLVKDPVLIANVHFTNPFQPPQPIQGQAWINLYFYQPGEMKVTLDGIFAINGMHVEPYQTQTNHRIWQPKSILTDDPVDAAVFQLFGHMHKRGLSFQIDYVKGGHCSVTTDRVCGRDDDCKAGQTCVLGPDHQDTTIYYTTEWDHAPIMDFPAPYFRVNRDEGLRWTCVHRNGVEGDPNNPPHRCSKNNCNGNDTQDCLWNDADQTCSFEGKIYANGDPTPLVFGEQAEDDMCNMFGYFLDASKLSLIGQ